MIEKRRERNDGTVRIEYIAEPLPVSIEGDDYEVADEREPWEVLAGTQEPGVLVGSGPADDGDAAHYHLSVGAPALGGVGGNMDPTERRYHGWRGTTGGRCVDAYGLRRVLSVDDRPRGRGFVVILSNDLAADQD